MTVELRPFEQSLPMALLRARETTMRIFRPLLAANDLTEQQWRVLRALTRHDGPIGVGELADATFLLGPSLTRILANLGDRGLLERSVAADDHRRGIINLTKAGRDLVATIAPHSEARYMAIEEAFGAQNLTLLMRLLDELECLHELTDRQEQR
ncbi:MAG: homoprotocatechuate degradation operon regulator HpaR [Actinomycetota bacterium]